MRKPGFGKTAKKPEIPISDFIRNNRAKIEAGEIPLNVLSREYREQFEALVGADFPNYKIINMDEDYNPNNDYIEIVRTKDAVDGDRVFADLQSAKDEIETFLDDLQTTLNEAKHRMSNYWEDDVTIERAKCEKCKEKYPANEKHTCKKR